MSPSVFATKVKVRSELGSSQPSIELAVEVDDDFYQEVGGANDPEYFKNCLEQYVRTFVDFHHILGLDTASITKVRFSKHPEPEKNWLFTPNTPLWQMLKKKGSGSNPVPLTVPGYESGESEGCQCSYCIPVEMTSARALR